MVLCVMYNRLNNQQVPVYSECLEMFFSLIGYMHTHTCPSLAKHLVSFDPNLCHLEECKSSYKNLLHPFDIAYLLSRVAWLACLGQSDDLGKLRQ